MEIRIAPEHKFKSGIYKINFGTKFYIGYAHDLDNRRRKHQSEINALLNGATMDGRNGYYRHIVSFIQRYPDITFGEMELLHECYFENRMHMESIEEEWILKLNTSGMCLNCSYPQGMTDDEMRQFIAGTFNYRQW